MQKSNKGNSIVLINKIDYLDKMYNILSDSKKIVKTSVVDEKHLNFIIGVEEKLTNLLKELKASEIDYKKLKPRVPVLVFYMACVKLTKISWANVHHLELFCQLLKLPLII